MRLPAHCRRDRGMALISSLLLLVVVTVLAVAMFRSYGIQERIAGNVREKERAVHAAQIAEQFAELWLVRDNNAAQAPVNCNQVLDATLGQGQICSNIMSVTNKAAVLNPLRIPWQTSGASPQRVGVQYMPTSAANSVAMHIQSTIDTGSWTTAGGTFYQEPQFYISDLGSSAVPGYPGEVFQIDAVGWGTTANAVAVLESTFVVGPEVVNLGGP